MSGTQAVFVCMPAVGTRAKYRCRCCGMQSDDPEQFGVSLCWECGFGQKWGCKRCREGGIEVALFGRPSKSHLLRTARRTRCGLKVTAKGWSGPGSCEPCARCFTGNFALTTR